MSELVRSRNPVSMKYPEYNQSDLSHAVQDGNYPVSDFHDFIERLIKMDALDHPVEKGIVAWVAERGTSELSVNQRNVLDRIVQRYDSANCLICGEKIPLLEVLDDEHDGLCSYHRQ